MDADKVKDTTPGIIVPGWWRKYTVWLSVVALALPELLQWALVNLDFITMIGSFDDAAKMKFRMALVAIIPLAAMIRQRSIPPKDVTRDTL